MLTFTLQALPHYPPEQRPTMVTEGRHFVAVHAELVGNVDSKPLFQNLKRDQKDKTEFKN